MKMETSCLAVIDIDAEYVGRQQVTGKLDALVFQAKGMRQGMGQGSLADAGNILYQEMATGQQAGQ
jgi:hypothetical protein